MEFLLVPIFILFFVTNPFTIVAVIYSSIRTGKYWIPGILGVLVHVTSVYLFFAVLIFSRATSFDDFIDEISFDSTESMFFAALTVSLGIIVSATILFGIRERRLKQSRPSKAAIVVLTSLLVIVVFSLSSLSDNILDKTYYFSTSLSQGNETEFKGHKIYLGDSLVYTDHGESLGIDKLNPDYIGVQSEYSLSIETGANERIEQIKQACLDEKNVCATGKRDTYQVISLGKPNSYDEEIISFSYYYSGKCDVYLRTWGSIFDDTYMEFIDRFFKDNCS